MSSARAVRSFFTVNQGHALRARQAARLGRALSMGRGSSAGSGVNQREARRRGEGGRGTRRWQAAAWPAASSAAALRRGPLPPRGHPRTAPLAVPPSRTPVTAPAGENHSSGSVGSQGVGIREYGIVAPAGV
jgi:hypothetical protein